MSSARSPAARACRQAASHAAVAAALLLLMLKRCPPAQGRLNMTLMARVSAQRAAQSKAAAASSGVKAKQCVIHL